MHMYVSMQHLNSSLVHSTHCVQIFKMILERHKILILLESSKQNKTPNKYPLVLKREKKRKLNIAEMNPKKSLWVF